MQRTEGNCIHCGRYVARDEDGTLIAEFTQLATCGDFYDPNPEDHQLDDEEEPEPDPWALDLLRAIFEGV